MFDRIDFHVREPEAGNSHIPAWAKEEHMEQSVSEKELWSYENNKKRGDKIMKKSVLLLILTAMVITASACDGSDVTGTMTMNSSAKQLLCTTVHRHGTCYIRSVAGTCCNDHGC